MLFILCVYTFGRQTETIREYEHLWYIPIVLLAPNLPRWSALHSVPPPPPSSPLAPNVNHQHAREQHPHRHHTYHHNPHSLSWQYSIQQLHAGPHLCYNTPLATPPSSGPGGAMDFDKLQRRKRQRAGLAASLNTSIGIHGSMNIGIPGSMV